MLWKLDNYRFEGGENSGVFIVKLNWAYDADGRVTVDPAIVFSAPGWDDEWTAAVGGNISIECSRTWSSCRPMTVGCSAWTLDGSERWVLRLPGPL